MNEIFARELNTNAAVKPAYSTPELWVTALSNKYNEEGSAQLRPRIRLIKKLWNITESNAELLSFLLQSSKSSSLALFASDFYLLPLECTDLGKTYVSNWLVTRGASFFLPYMMILTLLLMCSVTKLMARSLEAIRLSCSHTNPLLFYVD